MDFPDNWVDPLTAIPEIPRHPSISEESILSGYETDLSSVYDDAGYAVEFRDRALQVLRNYTPNENTDDTSQLLGAFVDHLPSKGRLVLMSEIDQHADDPANLRILRNFLVDAILKPMKVAGGKSPSYSTAPEFEGEINLAMTTIESSSRNGQRRLRQDCMKRDNNRCVISGIIDKKTFPTLPTNARQGRQCGDLECAHILPFALREFNENDMIQVRKKTVTWWALYRYFPTLVNQNIIGAATINQPENAMMLLTALHQTFGNFDIAFEPLNRENAYRCHIFDESNYTTAFIPQTVTFTQSSHGQTIPMPNPNLLRIHYILAKILNVSGLGMVIDNALDNARSLLFSNIAPDGSTDLATALSTLMLTGI